MLTSRCAASNCFSIFVEVESAMNSIVSLLLILETEKQESLIESLCEKLVKSREGERPSLRMQLWVYHHPQSPPTQKVKWLHPHNKSPFKCLFKGTVYTKGSSCQRLNPSFCVVCVFAKPFHTMASLTASVLIFSPSNSSSSSEMLSSLVESGWVFKCACIRSGCFCQHCATICYLYLLCYNFIFQRSLFLRTSLLFCEFSLNSLQLSCILFISNGKFPLFNPWILHFEWKRVVQTG